MEHTYSVGQTVKFALMQAADVCGYNTTATIIKLMPWGEYMVRTASGIEISAGDDDMAPLDEEPVQVSEPVAVEQSAALPVLQGSEKQVKWASDIRARYLAECQEALAEVQAKEGDEQALKVRSALYVVLSYPRYLPAAYWIERRSSQSYKQEIEFRMSNVLRGRVREVDKI